MNAPRAADLPVGSVVASAQEAYIKVEAEDHGQGQWYKTCSDDQWWDSEVQHFLDLGAQVLRVGDGGDR